MIALVASISFNVLLAVIFRWFRTYQIANLPAIVVNYFVAASLASFFAGKLPWEAVRLNAPWLLYAIILGLLFILGFSVVAATIQHFGMGLTAVFQKVSLVITAVFAIVFFQEAVVWQKLLGILLAIIAILFINRKKDSTGQNKKIGWLILSLPFLTFLFNGMIDTLLLYLEKSELVVAQNFHFISVIFLMAAILGVASLVYQILIHRTKVNARDIIGGITLGIPNFFSIHFFLLALGSGFDGSVVVPVNNAGIILGSAIIGFLFFREHFSHLNIAGIFLAVAAILLLSVPFKI